MEMKIWKKRKEIARVLMIALLAGLLGFIPKGAGAEGTGGTDEQSVEYHTIRISTEGLDTTAATCSVELAGVETPYVETPSAETQKGESPIAEKNDDESVGMEKAETPKPVCATKLAQITFSDDKKTADISVTLEDEKESWAKEVVVEVDGEGKTEKAEIKGKTAKFQIEIPENTPTPTPTGTPNTPEQVTPSPYTPEPVTPSPYTPEPVTPSPYTPEPVTPSPYTPGPVTPSPYTPEPVTPSPNTPKPVTPSPNTPEPVTPSPYTPEPVTPSPNTPEPATPSPYMPTPEPITPPPDISTSQPVILSDTPTPVPTMEPDNPRTVYEIFIGSTITALFGTEKPDSLKAANAASKKIVKISKNKITGLKAGTAKLTATYGGKPYTITVKVAKPSISLKAAIDVKRTLKYSKRYNRKLKVYNVKPVYKKINKKLVKNCFVTYKFKGKKYKINVNKMRSYDYILKKLKCQITVKMKNGIPPITVKNLKIKF